VRQSLWHDTYNAALSRYGLHEDAVRAADRAHGPLEAKAPDADIGERHIKGSYPHENREFVDALVKAAREYHVYHMRLPQDSVQRMEAALKPFEESCAK
jgi:hypothetical protein